MPNDCRRGTSHAFPLVEFCRHCLRRIEFSRASFYLFISIDIFQYKDDSRGLQLVLCKLVGTGSEQALPARTR